MPPFDPRPHRLSQICPDYHPPLYFVTFCTTGRRPVLACDEVHQALIQYAGKGLERSSVAVGRYVIMPDHVHLFIRGPDGFNLGIWIRGLKRKLSRVIEMCGTEMCGADVPIRLEPDSIHRRMGTSAPHEGTSRMEPDRGLWQEGLFDHIIRHSESYREKWAYVWQNPVRAGLVGHAEEWPYQGEITVIDRALNSGG